MIYLPDLIGVGNAFFCNRTSVKVGGHISAIVVSLPVIGVNKPVAHKVNDNIRIMSVVIF